MSESGRDIIKQRKNKGLPPRPDPAEFAMQMFQRDYENFNNNREKAETLFFDRSFLDSAMLIYQTDKAYFGQISDIIKTDRFNTKVFLTPPWQEIYTNDNERDQTFGESIHIFENLSQWYKLQGYIPLIIPMGSVAIRTEFILNEINRRRP